MRLLYCRWRPTPIRMISYTFTMHYGLHSAPFIRRAFYLPELEGSKPLFNRGSGRLEDWIKCFYEFVHCSLMFPAFIPNARSHDCSMPIIHLFSSFPVSPHPYCNTRDDQYNGNHLFHFCFSLIASEMSQSANKTAISVKPVNVL